MSMLEVLDHGQSVAISFADLLKYHGRSSIAGAAFGFKAMERALPLLADGRPPERYGIQIESAFPGGGARDAFEMVTRVVTGDRYRYTPELAPDHAPRGPEGRFYFRFHYEGTLVEATLRDGIATDEFVDTVCRGAESPAEEEAIARLKKEMADRLLGMAADEVYDVG